MKVFATLISLLVIINFELPAQFAGGTGTVGNPYQITTPVQLNEMRNNLNNYFILNNNIDLNVSPYNTGSGWVPVGTQAAGFSGGLDGNGHSILNLYISSGSLTDNGLFGYIHNGAILKNITLVNVNITGGTETGALVGYKDQSTIINCSSSGSISATNLVGGLIGYNVGALGTVSGCYSSVTIASHTDAGGLIGQNDYSASVINCSASGTVNGSISTGGFIGSNLSGTISQCYSLGPVIAISTNNGGFAGTNQGTINNSYSRGNVNFTNNTQSVGGFVGANDGGNISNCYNTGSISTPDIANGFTHWNINSGTITNSFWDTQTTGRSSSSEGAGKNTSEMLTQSTFTGAGWDFLSIWVMDGVTNGGYPYLQSTTVLPVELVSLTANHFDNEIILIWQTATEKNNYGFEIQRASLETTPSQVNWEKVGFIKGNGNSNSVKTYSYVDEKPLAGKSYYRLKQVDNDGQFEYSKTVETSFIKPDNFALEQNYPNPFNPSTTILYSIPKEGRVKLVVFNLLGQVVKTLVDENKEAGTYSIPFSATGGSAYGGNSQGLSSGVYLYTLESEGFVQSKKLTVLK